MEQLSAAYMRKLYADDQIQIEEKNPDIDLWPICVRDLSWYLTQEHKT